MEHGGETQRRSGAVDKESHLIAEPTRHPASSSWQVLLIYQPSTCQDGYGYTTTVWEDVRLARRVSGECAANLGTVQRVSPHLGHLSVTAMLWIASLRPGVVYGQVRPVGVS